ncbi:ExeM/NucH family extracellular endonuclease [Phenylobacterium sp.]|jgi:VCBS repeat-containing protein|uniref:ExeM/NucH family extracellular endonuclease n=1 Tax=Phenylobacterium sp. TaxID=1871053 RepID=UPI002F947891
MSTVYFKLSERDFFEDWNEPDLATVDNWNAFPSIVGYLGDYTGGTPTDVDARTLTGQPGQGSGALGAVDVTINQTNPNSASLAGGVLEMTVGGNRVIALNGSGTADAPSIVLYLDGTGRKDLTLSLDVIDLDTSTDNTAQQVAVMYRLGDTGPWTNVPGGYIADATIAGPVGQTTSLNLVLPPELNGKANIQVRILTTNASGTDETIGLDNIKVTSQPQGVVIPSVSVAAIDAQGTEGSPDDSLTFTLTRSGDLSEPLTVSYQLEGSGTAGADYTGPGAGTVTFAANSATATLTYVVQDDAVLEPNETIRVVLQSGAGYTVGAQGSAEGTIVSDELVVSRISAVQGAGAASGMVGQVVTIEAVVVGDFQNGDGDLSRDIGGFFVQEELADEDGLAGTSEGLFISQATLGTDVEVGQRVRVTGVVSEDFNITQLKNVQVTIIGQNASSEVKAAVLNLPANLESMESMLVTVPDRLVVTHMEDLDRLGEVRLYRPEGDGLGGAIAETGDGRPYTYTQIHEPDAAGLTAYDQAVDGRSIIYDDGLNGTWRPITNPDGGGVYNTANAVQTGDSITGLTGVLDFGFSNWRVRSVQDGQNTFTDSNPREPAPADVGGSLVVGSFNVLNFFVTLDTPGTSTDIGQDPRGADTQAEFLRQADKLIATLIRIDADVLALVELENDFSTFTGSTVAEGNALGYIVERLNLALGGDVYSYVHPGLNAVGSDAISTGFIYKNDVVEIVAGTHVAIDLDPVNNRPTIAVTFEEIATGGQFTAVANHFKSKGSGTGANADKGDGQGASNAGRVDQANRLLQFLAGAPTGTLDQDYLLLGDFNAYYQEDPIDVLRNAGFNPVGGPTSYSYTFDGYVGSLDHAMPNGTLGTQVTGSTKWHINSEEAPALDYNTDADDTNPATNRDPSIFDGTVPYRVSDHDPILVGLSLTPTNKLVVGTAGDDALAGRNGHDTLSGGEGADTLTGGQGDDLLLGGAGEDVAAYKGVRADYAVTRGQNGQVLVTGPEGADTLEGVEWLQFADGKVLIAQLLNRPPVAVADTGVAIEDGQPVALDVLGNDTDQDGDVLKLVSVDGAGLKGSVTANANGTVTYAPGAAFQTLAAGATAVETFSYTIEDRFGRTSTAEVAVTVTGVNDAPVAVSDTASVFENETVTIDVLSNDSDVDVGDTRTLVSVTGQGFGSVSMTADGKVRYVADADAFDRLGLNQTASETLTYVMRDATGATSTSTVVVTVTGVADAATQSAGNGGDRMIGTAAEERLEGGNGADRLFGMSGADTLAGGNGADVLDGGVGADQLEGGLGPDRFVFTGAFGADVVSDFGNGDQLQFDRSRAASFAEVLQHAEQVGDDVVISFDGATTVTLEDYLIGNLRAGDFLFV